MNYKTVILRSTVIGLAAMGLVICAEEAARVAQVIDQVGDVADVAGGFGVPYASLGGGLLGFIAEFTRGFFVKDKKLETTGALFRGVKGYLDEKLTPEQRQEAKEYMYGKVAEELGEKKADKANDYLQLAKTHTGLISRIMKLLFRK